MATGAVAIVLAATGATTQTLRGKVTEIHSSPRAVVIAGKQIYVTPDTRYHLIVGGFGGIETGRSYRVAFTTVGGKDYATKVTRVLAPVVPGAR